MRTYRLPYCSHCAVIHRRSQTGLPCPVCNRPLKLKTFRPAQPAIAAIAAGLVALLTIIIASIPIVWIGGFLAAVTLGIRAYQQSQTYSQLWDA